VFLRRQSALGRLANTYANLDRYLNMNLELVLEVILYFLRCKLQLKTLELAVSSSIRILPQI